MPSGEDAYGRLDYRGLIAWPERLQREGPLLQRVLAEAPTRRILDLGCGTGEHTRFLKSIGFDATGVDGSPAQLASAREADPEGRYVQSGLTGLTEGLEGGQGGAICLGNTLPHLCEVADVRAFFSGLASRLLPGAPFLLQLLNYDRILDRGERAFPVVLRPGDGDELVFLRLMTHHGNGRLTFTPATLRYRAEADAPLELVTAQTVSLRGWRRAELVTLLGEAGFQVGEVLGTMTGEAWSDGSSDLVVVAARK